MDLTETLDAPCSAAELFSVVADLGRYPEWLSIVPRAEPVEAGASGGAAWSVDLQGRLGPLSRSKRLRMERTTHDAPTRVRFERAERDGRDHSPWILDGAVDALDDGSSRLTMRLHYGGSLWLPVLERLLRQEIERSRPRLRALVTR